MLLRLSDESNRASMAFIVFIMAVKLYWLTVLQIGSWGFYIFWVNLCAWNVVAPRYGVVWDCQSFCCCSVLALLSLLPSFPFSSQAEGKHCIWKRLSRCSSADSRKPDFNSKEFPQKDLFVPECIPLMQCLKQLRSSPSLAADTTLL